ncbi:colicin Ia central receptor-binding domain-containing protein [Escherichia coli]|nr:colicin Ia central receptor-binding domain-containing protein [Escherichia coli]MDC9165912.1 colicin Ia central receptor-binding domain-containing protein [Escherichia coli]
MTGPFQRPNKLSSVTESLNTARNALTRAEQQLTQQKNTPDGKTIVSPEKFPGVHQQIILLL